jgi:hypothetical protein
MFDTAFSQDVLSHIWIVVGCFVLCCLPWEIFCVGRAGTFLTTKCEAPQSQKQFKIEINRTVRVLQNKILWNHLRK